MPFATGMKWRPRNSLTGFPYHQFLLTIFDTLESRSRSNPELFQDIQLTLLGDVAQNGVQTLSSVKGEGLLLCEQVDSTTIPSPFHNSRLHAFWTVVLLTV